MIKKIFKNKNSYYILAPLVLAVCFFAVSNALGTDPDPISLSLDQLILTNWLKVKNVGIGVDSITSGVNLDVNGKARIKELCLGESTSGDNNCKSAWPTAGTNYWTLSGNNLSLTSSSTKTTLSIPTHSGIEILGTGTNGFNIYAASNNDLHLGIGNIPVISINRNYNVGIGTNNPSQKLEVSGNILVKGLNNFNANDNSAYLYLGDTNHYIKSVHGKGVIIGTYKDASGSIEPLFIQQGAGNVGIGTTSPTAKLEISGDVKIGGGISGKPSYSLIIGQEISDSNTQWVLLPDSNSSPSDSCNGDIDQEYICPSGAQKECTDISSAKRTSGGQTYTAYWSRKVKCVIDNFTYRINNNLGTLQFINSANTTTVSISQAGNLLLRGSKWSEAGDNSGILFLGDANHYIKSVHGKGVMIGTYKREGGPIEPFFIQQETGNVGIGTNNPAAKLDVRGIVSTSNGFVVSDGTDTFVSLGNDNNRNLELRSKGGTPYIDFSNDTEKKNNNYTTDFDMRIILTGNDTLEVQGGNLKVEGKVSSGSDIALKKDIQKLDDNMIGKVMQLNPVTYRWKNDSEKDNINYGLIAQEVEKIFPDMVSGEEGSKSISYDSLIPVLIKAVQEQQQEIEQLKSEIQSLKQK